MSAYILAVIRVDRRDAGDLGIGTKTQDTPVRKLQTVLDAIQGGTLDGSVGFSVIDDAGTEPDGTIAVTAANVTSGTDTITFTWMSSTVVLTAGTDYVVNTASDTIQAEHLRDAINAHPLLRTVLRATAATGTVTVFGKFPGDILENIAMSTSDATAFGLTAIGSGSAGVNGAAQKFFQGVDHR